MLFRNFMDAHNHLKLEGSYHQTVIGDDINGISSVKITAHKDSLNEFLGNGKYIHYIGIGSQKTPGYPTLNQNAKKQIPFIKSAVNQGAFPVLYKQENSQVSLLGYYTVLKTQKKMSPAGFTYFMITLFRQY